ncbi:MAG: hypothetical protein U1A78_15315 [Polyangia bacterium]
MSNNTLNGAMTGMLVAAAANWARYDDDTQRRLRNIRNDAEAALDEIRILQSRGEMIRLRIPVVQDFQVGLALASPALLTPQITPSVIPLTRPNLTNVTPSAISDLQWPPVVGSYDPNGMTTQAGDMTVLSLALSFEEVRAFILGLTQPSPPMSNTKLQIFYAANGLVQALAQIGITQSLTLAQYTAIWLALFKGAVPGGGGSPTGDVHSTTASAPSVLSTDAAAAVTPLGRPEIQAYTYEHQNTDRSSKWRVTVTGTLASTNTIATFKFGSAFTRNGHPYQPSVQVNDGRMRVASVQPDKFSLVALVQFQNETVDLGITVTGGD